MEGQSPNRPLKPEIGVSEPGHGRGMNVLELLTI